eukprot:2466636-Pleurochrysis_carterae.AAC.3
MFASTEPKMPGSYLTGNASIKGASADDLMSAEGGRPMKTLWCICEAHPCSYERPTGVPTIDHAHIAKNRASTYGSDRVRGASFDAIE